MARGTRGEEKKVEGPIRKLSVTLGNSKETGFQLVQTRRCFPQIRLSARAWARFLSGVGPLGLELAQHYCSFSFFFYNRALEIC
jgi:hypothetical protein